MATVIGRPTKIVLKSIKTSIGDLIFPLTYIDVPITEGDSLTVNGGSTPWKPYFHDVSLLATGDGPRYSDFTTSDGFITGKYNARRNEYTIKIAYTIGTKEQTFTRVNKMIPSEIVVVGSNGVPYIDTIPFTNSKSSDFNIISYPSNYGFGVINSETFESRFSVTEVTADTLQRSKEFFDRVQDIPTDPYTKGDSTSAGGGGGTFGGGNTIFGGASDSIDIPPLPTASASAAGFITLFNPTLGQLNNLASYMWSDLFSLDTFKKIFADPMDCILGLSIVPVKPASAGTSTVKIGNVSTDVSMNKTSSQYVAVDCGTIDVKEYWGAYLDYAPYTQCEIYLPYVGTKQISVDDVMNKSVHVVYHVDILSGACNAYVKCGDSVLYTFVGQCSSSIPISGNDWTNVLNGAISVAGKIGLAMATGGATALMSGLGAASSIISSSKPTVERSGAMSSTGGLLGIQKPYLILTRPKQALPENQNKYTGYPSFITMALSECTGYTEIDSVHLENMPCTDEETQEIENLLKSGVIF